MFNASDVEVGSVSKYQRAGVSEKVQITEFTINTNPSNGNKTISFKTINENGEIGSSKRLSLNTVVNEGKQTSGWKVTARTLINIIVAATGKSVDEAKAVLDAKNEEELVSKLTKTLIGKAFRGLFSSKEYQPGKFAIELFAVEPVGGKYLVYDFNNPKYNERLPLAAGAINTNGAGEDQLPF